AELRLARLAAATPELRVALRSELRLPRFAALATELRVAIRTELTLPGLPAPLADLAIERGAVFSGGRGPATLPGLADRELAALERRGHRVHMRRGTAVLRRIGRENVPRRQPQRRSQDHCEERIRRRSQGFHVLAASRNEGDGKAAREERHIRPDLGRDL